MEKNINSKGDYMYNPTPDDEVQITRKICGRDCLFSIRKKKRLSLLDKIKKTFKLADEWIDYEYYSAYYQSIENAESPTDMYHISADSKLKKVDNKLNIKNTLWNAVRSLGKNFIKEEFTIYGVVYGKDICDVYTYGENEIAFYGTDVFKEKNFESPDASKLIFDQILNIPHIEILHTGEWSEEIHREFLYNNYIEGTSIPHLGIMIKHVSGDKEKVRTFYNPDYIKHYKTKVGDNCEIS